MNAQSRQYDEFVEKTIGDITCDRVWSRLKQFERVADVARQVKGMDYIVGERGVKIDEKVKYKGCMNQVLEYPGFEVSRLQRNGIRSPGWFVDDQMETDIYSLVNVWTRDQDEHGITKDKITRLHMTLISADELKRAVFGFVRRDQLLADADGLIRRNERRRRYHTSLFHLTFSQQLSEKPVNLVLHLDCLRHLKSQGRFRGLKEIDIWL